VVKAFAVLPQVRVVKSFVVGENVVEILTSLVQRRLRSSQTLDPAGVPRS